MPDENYESLEAPLIGAWKGKYKVVECFMKANHIGWIGICSKKTQDFGVMVWVLQTNKGVCYASKVEKVYE